MYLIQIFVPNEYYNAEKNSKLKCSVLSYRDWMVKYLWC